MIIKWSDHKAGFVRRQNALYRGQQLFNTVFTVTSAAIIPQPVVPGVPGPVRILTQWSGVWIEPTGMVTAKARVFLNRVFGFEARILDIEAEIEVLDALLIEIQADIATNTTDIETNAAAISVIETTIISLQADIEAIDAQIIDILLSIFAIETRLDALEDSGIVEANSNYTVQPGDKIINCNGTLSVTLIGISSASDPITVTSTAGTITLIADAPIQSPTTVTTGASSTLYPARSSWFHA